MPLHPQAQAICDLDQRDAADIAPSDERLQSKRATGCGLLLAMAGGAPEAVFSDRGPSTPTVCPCACTGRRPIADLPVFVCFHGGGWMIGSVEQFDPITRQVANATGAIVVSVDYRLAPEHPFPAPLDDCWRRARSGSSSTRVEFGGDAARLAVGGDSAGGNLAAVCALLARDAGAPQLALQVLVYPVVDCDFDTASYVEQRRGLPARARTQMRWFFDCYTGGGDDPRRLAGLAAARARSAPASRPRS